MENKRQAEADEKKIRDETANGSGKVKPMNKNDPADKEDGIMVTKTKTPQNVAEGGEVEITVGSG